MNKNTSIEICLPVRFISGGQFIATKGWVHTHRTIDTAVLIVVQSGRFAICEDGQVITLDSHEALILSPGLEHYGIHIENEIPPVYYWAHFINGDQGSGSALFLPRHICNFDYPKAISYYHQLLTEAHLQNRNDRVCNYLTSIVLSTLVAREEGISSKGKSIADQIKEYINMHYRSNITLEELSQEFNYSPDHISRIFRKAEDMSFRDYLHVQRIEHAKTMLMTEHISIKEVAAQCGYENEKYFMTRFKQITGITPTNYMSIFSPIHKNNR